MLLRTSSIIWFPPPEKSIGTWRNKWPRWCSMIHHISLMQRLYVWIQTYSLFHFVARDPKGTLSLIIRETRERLYPARESDSIRHGKSSKTQSILVPRVKAEKVRNSVPHGIIWKAVSRAEKQSHVPDHWLIVERQHPKLVLHQMYKRNPT